MKFSRRTFVVGTAAALAARGAAGAPARLKRADCFFGLHFDLHPNDKDTALGRDVSDAMVAHLLESCKPDFIQYDSKGHVGYLGFPSKTGMSAPGIVQDSLAIWRRVTAAHGVALYNHFSGVLDGLAIEKHPEWARVAPDGEHARAANGTSGWETSLFGPYVQKLMIPELIEAALNYDLDGSWVDGECWAVKPDYCDAARELFQKKTGLSTLPKKPEDKGWIEFLDIQREAFRQHVRQYVEALHKARPGFQITSNWIYSTSVPERPEIPVDYISGDMADAPQVQQARMEARYISQCGKPWDLFSWGFDKDSHYGYLSAKPASELQQEASVVLAQGGAFGVYYGPTRSGWIDDRIVKSASEASRYCRQRQRWSHRSESIPQVGVLYSGRTLYRTADQVFGGWGGKAAPAMGAVEMLLSCGYSVDLIPDWKMAESAAAYPLIVVPDWQDIGDEVADTLASYVSNGGRLVVFGAENASLFSSRLDLRLKGQASHRAYLVADEFGFARIAGKWMEFDAAQPGIAAYGYGSTDTRKDGVPIAAAVSHGKGSAVVCPGPMTSLYATNTSHIYRSLARTLLKPLFTPMVQLEGDHPDLEIVLRRKDGQTLVHLINLEGAAVNDEVHQSGAVPHTGPIRLRIRLPKPPSKVVLEPEGRVLTGKYAAGEWSGELPDLQIHSIVRVSS
ncbi:MAG: hypothetical protein FWD64_09495 [Acidobacteriaceae bacterium]|nr:hypothetical protein [Acidobacteriaceae bacterium]